MIGHAVTSDKDGNPVDSNGTMLAKSAYQPSKDVMELFQRVQTDYQTAWTLQHRPFREFDGLSLLDRARLDQETFSAYVGIEMTPNTKKWRWRGRKNTARNRLLSIAAHMLNAMLFPFVYATNSEDNDDKMTARVARILIEDHLKNAGYEIKFLYMLVSALVNPCVWVGVEYVMALQRIKEKLTNGEIKITEAVDELLSGLQLNIYPVDDILCGDFYSGSGQNIQRQPYIVKVRRISYDEARKIYSKKKYVMGSDGEMHDMFDFVQAGKTRVFIAGQTLETLFDIEWTEADANFVQEITASYRGEDLEVTFVAGVFFGNEEDLYNSNPFTHRRLSLIGDSWKTVPIYPYAQSGFEPLDPTGRFLYFKSGAFKQYWDDQSQNRAHQMLHDGTYLDVIKPVIISGIAKADQSVIVPGATIALPMGATMSSWSMSPNIAAAFQLLSKQENDMGDSTQNPMDVSGDSAKPGVAAANAAQAQQNAQIFLGLFGIMIADLVKQVGELSLDEIIAHTTVGEVDATIPDSLRMKYKPVVARSKSKGKTITNKVLFTDKLMGKKMTKQQVNDLEWNIWEQAGGAKNKDTNVFLVNGYKFARTRFGVGMDASEIISYASGTKQAKDQAALAAFTQPFAQPFVNMEAVIEDFVIDPYGGNDPDRYKANGRAGYKPGDLLNATMGNNPGGQGQPTGVPSPINTQQQTGVVVPNNS